MKAPSLPTADSGSAESRPAEPHSGAATRSPFGLHSVQSRITLTTTLIVSVVIILMVVLITMRTTDIARKDALAISREHVAAHATEVSAGITAPLEMVNALATTLATLQKGGGTTRGEVSAIIRDTVAAHPELAGGVDGLGAQRVRRQ